MSRGDGLARLTDALEASGCRVQGGSAQCPAHDDRNPSLSVGQGRIGAIFKCHAGCPDNAVLGALGLDRRDLRDEQPPARDSRRASYEVIATYAYQNENGNDLYYVERRAPKDFRQYRMEGGRKVWKLGGVRQVPYRLPELLAAARAGKTVWVAEGEKDCDALMRAGAAAATCNPGGRGKWRDEYARWFKDAGAVNVVADRDRDGGGLDHARVVAGSLRGTVPMVEIVQAAEGKDAHDHLAAGRGLDDFTRLNPDGGMGGSPQVIRLADVKPEHVEWLWQRYLPRGKLVVLDGDPDQGKSAVSLDLAARISAGSPMPDGAEPVSGAVLILSAEDGLADTIRPRLDAAGGDPAQVIAITEIPAAAENGQPAAGNRQPAAGNRQPAARPVAIPGDLPAIEKVITRNGVVLVIVDVLMAYLDGTVNSHRDQDVRRALYPLAAMAERTGCCVVVIRHLNKSGGQHAIYRGGGSIGIVGAARAGFMIGADPDDPTGRTRVLAPVKCNLAQRPPALAYRLLADELHDCVRVEWLGVSDHRAADLLAADDDEARDERTAAEEAAEWVIGYLRDQGSEARSADVKKAARSAGIPERTLQRGRVKARVRITTSGFPATSIWRLSDDYGELPMRSKQAPVVPVAPSPSAGTAGTTGAASDAAEYGELPPWADPGGDPDEIPF